MAESKFLLIKSITAGMWHEMHHVITQLLAAEILKRIPVVYWGRESLYAVKDRSNAFEQFFLPVSDYNLKDLTSENLSFFPEKWNHSNLSAAVPVQNRNTAPAMEAWTECRADVLVQDTYVDVEQIIPYIPVGHPFYGYNCRDLLHGMINKYIRLRKDVLEGINSFYNKNMNGTPMLAVHIRSSDKAVEVRNLQELNDRYPLEINRFIRENPSIRIFLMTDCIEILEEYKKIYGEILFHTDCKRVPQNGPGVHFQEYPDNMIKGFEIILDTWLAAKCDFFIGNGYSNVSLAISELKDWQKHQIKLLY